MFLNILAIVWLDFFFFGQGLARFSTTNNNWESKTPFLSFQDFESGTFICKFYTHNFWNHAFASNEDLLGN